MAGQMPRIKEKALNTELAKHGFESVSVKRELPDGRVEVDANKLHPVHVEGGETIYAPIPVSLSVALDHTGRRQVDRRRNAQSGGGRRRRTLRKDTARERAAGCRWGATAGFRANSPDRARRAGPASPAAQTLLDQVTP